MEDGGRRFGKVLTADITRLGQRPYAEVGVPMFLLAEDLRGVRPQSHAPEPVDETFASTLKEMGRALTTETRDIPAGEVARLIEVLADRRLLGRDGPDFTRLSDAEDGQ